MGRGVGEIEGGQYWRDGGKGNRIVDVRFSSTPVLVLWAMRASIRTPFPQN